MASISDCSLSPHRKERTLQHDLQIVTQAIDLLKAEVGKAESNRLSAGRVRDERYSGWKQLELKLASLDDKLQESKLIAEFLLEDVESLQDCLQAQQFTCRLSEQSEDRIQKLEELLREKTAQLAHAQEQEEIMRLKLQALRNAQHSSQSENLTGGGGDIESVHTKSFANLHKNESELGIDGQLAQKFANWDQEDAKDKTTRLGEKIGDLQNQCNTELEQDQRTRIGDLTFGGHGNKELEQNRRTTIGDLKDQTERKTDLEQDQRTAELENGNEFSLISSGYAHAREEKKWLEEEINFMSMRLIELRRKKADVNSELNLWKIELELKERQLKEAETKTQNLSSGKSAKTTECENSKIAYMDAEKSLIEADEIVRTLKKLMRKKIGERTKLEEKIDRELKAEDMKRFSSKVTENLPISISDHYPNVNDPLVVKYLQCIMKGTAQTPTPFWTDDVENLNVAFNDRLLEKNESNPENPKRKERFQPEYISAQPSPYQLQYQPPPIVFRTTSIRNSGPIISSARFPFGFPWENRFGKNTILEASVGSLSKFCHKFSNILAYGVNKYPKLVVANGVMYKIPEHNSGEPVEKVYGPLTLDLWRRHSADVQKFSMTSQSIPCDRFLRPTVSATLLKCEQK